MPVRKRSVSINGHRTSYSIEDEFQHVLATLAGRENLSLAALITRIDAERPRDANLSSALRLHALNAALNGLLPAGSAATENPGRVPTE